MLSLFMQKILITLKKIEVTQFTPKKAEAQVSIWFSHTTPHVLHWTLQAGDKQEYLEKIMADIKKFVRDFHPSKVQGDFVEDILSAHKLVAFANDEATEEKLSAFLGKLVDKLKKLKSATTSTGYLTMVADFEKMGMEF